MNTIAESLRFGSNIEKCLQFINEILLMDRPPYMILLYSEVHIEILRGLSSFESENLRILCQILCNLAYGPKECCEALRNFACTEKFLKILAFSSSFEEVSLIIKGLGNLIDGFQGFYEFKNLNGFNQITETLKN